MSYRHIMNDPDTKIGRWEYIHREDLKVKAERRALREREERERVRSALEGLATDNLRDELVNKAVAAVQSAAVPTLVTIDTVEIRVGDGPSEPADVKAVIEEKLAESRNAGPESPPWLPILWECMLESTDVEFKIGIGLPPVDFSVKLDVIKFVKLVYKRRVDRT